MKKIYKIVNIALIFTLIVTHDATYASNNLRVPILNNTDEGKKLLKDGLENISKSVRPERQLPKKIKASQIVFIGQSNKQKAFALMTQEVIYIDENGQRHECFARWAEKRKSHFNFIVPQARILRYLEKKGVKGIPKVRDFVILDGKRMLLFDKFPKGEILDKKIDKLSQYEAIDIVLRASRIVKSLFDNGVYHWDINPTNIYIADDGEVILFDFDIAFMTMQEFKKRHLDLCGSFSYISLSRSFGNVSIAEEIHSLAITLKSILPDNLKKQKTLEIALNKARSLNDWGEKNTPIKYEETPYTQIDQFIKDLEKAKRYAKLSDTLCDRQKKIGKLGGPLWWVSDPSRQDSHKNFRYFVKQLLTTEEILQAVEKGKIVGKELASFSLIDSEHTVTLLGGAIGLLVKVEDEGILLARPEDIRSGRNKTMEKVQRLKQDLKDKGKPSIEKPEELLNLTPDMHTTQRNTKTPVLWNEVILNVSKTSVTGIFIKVPMVMPLLYEDSPGRERENLELFFEKLFSIDSSIPVVVLETPECETKEDDILPDMPCNVREAQDMILNIRKKIFRANLNARRISESKMSL